MAPLPKRYTFGIMDITGIKFLDDNPDRAIGRESLAFTDLTLGESRVLSAE